MTLDARLCLRELSIIYAKWNAVGHYLWFHY